VIVQPCQSCGDAVDVKADILVEARVRSNEKGLNFTGACGRERVHIRIDRARIRVGNDPCGRATGEPKGRRQSACPEKLAILFGIHANNLLQRAEIMEDLSDRRNDSHRARARGAP
jgi:hypothetical protein